MKAKRTANNVGASIVEVIIAQIITLLVSREVLNIYGSEINGVNAVFTNIIAWVLLLEGGFTFASSVSLFKAYASGDGTLANKILSATKIALRKIGFYVGLVGVVISLVFPLIIKADINYWDLVIMFLLMSFGTSFGLFYTRKYALMFSVKQQEYYKIYISIVIAIIINIAVFFLARYHVNYLWIRVAFALGVVLTGVLTFWVVKKKYSYVNYNEDPDFSQIKGTKDMVFNKMITLLKSTAPLFYIAVAIGSVYASVYAVYMIIFGFLTKLCLMISNAAQNGFGQLIAEADEKKVFPKFVLFEFIMLVFSFFLLSVAIPLTMPFIKFYTKNVVDVNYIEWSYLVLFSLVTIIPILHIPSGIIMLMSGAFKKAKQLQIYTLIIMVILVPLLGFFFSVQGVLCGLFLSELVLCIGEILYARNKYFKMNFFDLCKQILVISLIALILVIIEIKIFDKNMTIIMIFTNILITTIVNGSVFVIVSRYLFKEHFFNAKKMLLSIIKPIKYAV